MEHCTIFRAGLDTIQHHASKCIRLEYNDLYDGNMLKGHRMRRTFQHQIV